MKTPPEKYAQPTEVKPGIPKDKPEPLQPTMATLLPTPGRTKTKGNGAATRGLTFGKNG